MSDKRIWISDRETIECRPEPTKNSRPDPLPPSPPVEASGPSFLDELLLSAAMFALVGLTVAMILRTLGSTQ